MPSIRIDCPGEVPVLEHRQHHTQGLLVAGGKPELSELIRAQARDLLSDGQASGVEQDQLLALCLEAIRQLADTEGKDRWEAEFGDIALSFGPGRRIRPSEPFRSIDLGSWMDIVEPKKLEETAGHMGPSSHTEQATGLPDPERLVASAALCLVEGYLALSGNSLHATYEIDGLARWADADASSLTASADA